MAASDFRLSDEVSGKLEGTITAGTMLRTEAPDPAQLGALSAASVGRAPGQLSGTAGGSDLNFQKGRPVSTVLKAVFDFELKRRNLGLFVRARAWHDFELESGNRAYGNAPNGFTQNVPLSDRGFDPASRFSNAQLADAYVFGRFHVGEAGALDLRLGRQVVNWGTAQFVAGGINAVNPLDYAAQTRPGALSQEAKVPVGMLYANLAQGQEWGVDGFAQYEFRPHVQPGCGTFFGLSSYAPTGCGFVSLLGGPPFNVEDATALAASLYPKRHADLQASAGGQYGLSLRFSPAAHSEFRLYAMNYHSRAPSIRVTNANVAGGYGAMAPMTRLTDPDGLRYRLLYVEDVQLYGASFRMPVDSSLLVFGELAYRPNQPINLNASDLVAAFFGRSPSTALNLARNTNQIAPGGTFDSYDRFGVTTASLGFNKASKEMARVVGAEQLTLSGELGWSHVANLPDPGVLRYGRSEAYGIAAIDGMACVDTSAARKSCAHDGFVTRNAWGYRLRLSANYPAPLIGAMLTPSLTLAHDVHGYAYDGTFSHGRKVLLTGLRADWGQRYFADVLYTRIAGGSYNLQVDRDHLTLAVGASF